VKTPHGATVQGAFVRVIGATGPIAVRERRPGRYRFLLSPSESYEIVIDGPKQGFEFQTYRGILQYSAADEKCVFIRGDSRGFVPATSVLGEEIKWKGLSHNHRMQRQDLDIVLDYKWFTPIGFPPTLGNRVELLIDGEDGWAALGRADLNLSPTS